MRLAYSDVLTLISNKHKRLMPNGDHCWVQGKAWTVSLQCLHMTCMYLHAVLLQLLASFNIYPICSCCCCHFEHDIEQRQNRERRKWCRGTRDGKKKEEEEGAADCRRICHRANGSYSLVLYCIICAGRECCVYCIQSQGQGVLGRGISHMWVNWLLGCCLAFW